MDRFYVIQTPRAATFISASICNVFVSWYYFYLFVLYFFIFSKFIFLFYRTRAKSRPTRILKKSAGQTKGKRKANERQRSAPECKQAKSPPTRKPKNVGRPNERQTKGKRKANISSCANGQNRCRQEKQENGRPNERHYILLISIEILSPSIEPQTAI